MTPTIRTLHDDAARYAMNFDGVRLDIDYRWHRRVDDALAERIVELMRHTSASAPIIGFAEEISDEAAAAYIADLRANLAANKCRLLVISTAPGLLIGLCTLRRNLNPNNGHIAVPVPPAQRGMVWSVENAGGRGIKFLTTPPVVAFSPAGLLLPKEVMPELTKR